MNGHVAFENTATSGVACRESVRDARRAGSDICHWRLSFLRGPSDSSGPSVTYDQRNQRDHAFADHQPGTFVKSVPSFGRPSVSWNERLRHPMFWTWLKSECTEHWLDCFSNATAGPKLPH